MTPIPTPEVAAVLHERRFKRFVTRIALLPKQRIDANGKKCCRWCGASMPPGSRRTTWCSEACRSEFLVRFDGSAASRSVHDRDKGVCASCGLDTDSIQHELNRIRRTHDGIVGDMASRDNPEYWAWEQPWRDERRSHYKALLAQWGPWYSANRRYWEADHIIPVIEGGGCCGLSNYQTLCLKCHKADTASLARRRAEQRDVVKNGPKLAIECNR